MPMLTRSQWLTRKDRKGTYAGYVSWWKKKVAPQFNPPKGALAPWTNRQIRTEAAKQVKNIYGAQKSQLEAERASRVGTIQASSQAASQLLREHVPAVQGAYSQATRDLGGISAGYSDAMKSRIQGAQAAAADFASTQAAPAAPPAVDAQALADTAYHGGAAIPGASLASQGAAETSLASTMAGIPMLQQGRDIRQTEMDYEKDLLELARKRPELTDTIAQRLFDNELKKLDARIKRDAQKLYSRQFGETTRHHLATEKAATTRNAISYQKMVQSHQDAIDKAAREGRQPNAALSKAYGYIVDKNGNPIVDGNGKKIPVAKTAGSKAARAKAAAQYGKAVGEASKMFKESRPGRDDFGDPTPAKRAWKWGAALRFLMNRYGIKRAAARKALIAAGFKAPPAPGPRNQKTEPYPGTPGDTRPG